MNKINYLDLFSGIGGFHLGMKNAAIDLNSCFYSEIDKFANSIYQKHFNNSIGLGDVKSIKPVSGKLSGTKINLVTFGFPCQDLSIAGNRKGFQGDKSSLFFEAIRIIEKLKPDYFIFENVKGFFSSNRGKDFAIALQEIANIRYDGQWQLVNTAWFLPQNRERIYFVGYPRGSYSKQIFPLKQKNTTGYEGCSKVQPDFRCLTARGYLASRGNFLTKINHAKTQHDRVYDANGSACTLTSSRTKTGLYSIDNNIRSLTPVECERLQGFPDNWTQSLSDNQRYKCLGNAVSVPVVTQIIKNIFFNS